MDGWNLYVLLSAFISNHFNSHFFQLVSFNERVTLGMLPYDLTISAEHHTLYQYSLVNAKSHWMGLIQTETVRY